MSSAVVPLAPALIRRRLKRGKEDPARVGERRGVSHDVRPQGPLVWIHGASVGEVLAAAALIERLRALNLRILADLGHGDVGGDRRQAVSRRRHPSIRAVRFAALRRALPRSLAAFAGAVHRVRSVAQSHPVERGAAAADGADQRPDVASLVPALAPDHCARISALLGRFDICLAQSQADAERFAALGSRNVITTGNLKLDVPAPPADAARLERLMAMTRGRPIIVAASTHPGEEEILSPPTSRCPASFPRF